MGKSIFSKVFSISDYGETHRILYIFGIKIKFPKSEYVQKQKSNPYESYKKNNVDITQIPSATGQIRDIQLANFELLKELDYVCRQNNLKYWLDFGTLLGALRHKGFIPWDDDIDTGMMREDYEKLYEVFDKTKRNPDLYLKVYADRKNNILLKICHKRSDNIFVDIFTYDKCAEPTHKEKSRLIREIKKIDRKNIYALKTFDNIENKINGINARLYQDDEKNKNYIVFGLEYVEPYRQWFFEQKMAFPLTEMEFEGYKFPVFNDYKKYLEQIYGNYMSYPKKFGMGHSMYLDLSGDDKQVIAELTGKKE